jgi:hypothetical protein
MSGRTVILALLKTAANKGETLEVYTRAEPDPSLPLLLRQKPLSHADARNFRNALATVVPYDALRNTRLDLNGLQHGDLRRRADENTRATALSKYWEREAYAGMDAANKRTRFRDAYLPGADVVALPSGSAAIAAHELGHAIDFNAFPEDSTLRRTIAHMYRNYSPRLWQEHAAWRKGRKAVEDAAAARELRLAVAHRALAEMPAGRRMGLGSYWGAGLGALAGWATPFAATLAMESASAGRLPALAVWGRLAAAVGAAAGGAGGFYLGRALSPNKVDKVQVAERLAKAISAKTKEPVEPLVHEILRAVARSEAARKTKKKSKPASPVK